MTIVIYFTIPFILQLLQQWFFLILFLLFMILQLNV